MEQNGDYYIRPNPDLEIRLQIRNNEQLNDFENHIESVPNRPRVQTPYRAVLFYRA